MEKEKWIFRNYIYSLYNNFAISPQHKNLANNKGYLILVPMEQISGLLQLLYRAWSGKKGYI